MGQNSFRGRILVTHCCVKQTRGKNFVISVYRHTGIHDNKAKYFKKEIPSDFKGLYRVFHLWMYENKRLLGHQKCTFKS